MSFDRAKVRRMIGEADLVTLDELIDAMLAGCGEACRVLQIPVTELVRRAVEAHCEARDLEMKYFEVTEEDEIDPREGLIGGVETVVAMSSKWKKN